MTRRLGWEELDDGVFVHRWEYLRLNTGLVVGDAGAVAIDAGATIPQGRAWATAIRAVTAKPVIAVIDTHHHWDHAFGNGAFVRAEIVGHVRCRERLLADGERVREELRAAAVAGEAWAPDPAELAETEIVPPERVLERRLDLDLGGRAITVAWYGRGHTDNDVVVYADDSDVLFAGDLVEEGAPPAFEDAFPAEWPATARVVAGHGERFVPGHGEVVDRSFVLAQIGHIADAVAAVRAGVTESGPFPPETMRTIAQRLSVPT